MREFLAKLIAGVGIIVIVLLIVGIFSAWPTQLLWNWLMPSLFGLRTVTFWEAFGLVILSGLLFRTSSSSKTKE